jgi:hypothetical protein
MLSYHTTGDGLTMATLQGAYESNVRAAGASQNLRTAWIRGAGHCAFTPAENAAALAALEERLVSGQWQASPEHLNALAAASGLAEGAVARSGSAQGAAASGAAASDAPAQSGTTSGTPAAGRFVDFKPAPFLRPCSRSEPRCAGEPR